MLVPRAVRQPPGAAITAAPFSHRTFTAGKGTRIAAAQLWRWRLQARRHRCPAPPQRQPSQFCRPGLAALLGRWQAIAAQAAGAGSASADGYAAARAAHFSQASDGGRGASAAQAEPEAATDSTIWQRCCTKFAA